MSAAKKSVPRRARPKAEDAVEEDAPQAQEVPEERVDYPDTKDEPAEEVIMCQRGGNKPADWITRGGSANSIAYCDERRPANHDQLDKERIKR